MHRVSLLFFGIYLFFIGSALHCAPKTTQPHESATENLADQTREVTTTPDAATEDSVPEQSMPEPKPEPVAESIPEPLIEVTNDTENSAPEQSIPEPKPELAAEAIPESLTEVTNDNITPETPMAIPDPGTANGDAPQAWRKSTGKYCTPATAAKIGIVTKNPGYVEGNACASTGNIFYVFKTGPAMTSFSVQLFGGKPIAHVHLHDGDGLKFGAAIKPTKSTNESGTWPVKSNHVYVLEVRVVGGGLF